jgi:hypothetical protein
VETARLLAARGWASEGVETASSRGVGGLWRSIRGEDY